MKMGEGSGEGAEKEEVLMKGNKVGSYCDMERGQTSFGITWCVWCEDRCDCYWNVLQSPLYIRRQSESLM